MIPSLKSYRFLILQILLLAMVCGCSESDNPQFTPHKKGADEEKPQGADAEQTGSEDTINEPQMAGGAFLICRYVSAEETALDISGEEKPIGCAVKNSNQQYDGITYQLLIKKPSGEVVPLRMKTAAASSSWQVYGALPSSIEEGSVLRLVVQDSQGRQLTSYDYATSDLRQQSALPLNLVSDAAWNMGEGLGDAYNGVSPICLCAANAIRPLFESSLLGNLAAPFTFDRTIQQKKVPLKGRCFKQLKQLGGQGVLGVAVTPLQWMVEGEGCYFVRTSDDQVLIFSQAGLAAQGATKEDLQAMVTQTCLP
jgi:hypothetical protein